MNNTKLNIDIIPHQYTYGLSENEEILDDKITKLEEILNKIILYLKEKEKKDE